MNELKKQKRKNRLSIILLILICIILLSLGWFKSTFSNVTLDELIFHIKVPLQGSNLSFIQSYLLYLKDNGLIFLFIICATCFLLSQRFKHQYKVNISLKLFKFVKKINWNIKDDRKILFHVISIIFIITIIYTFIKLDVHTYLYNEFHPSKLFEDYYVDTKKVKLEFPEQKQNLIYIFMESMESSYYNLNLEGVEQKNLIPNLENLAKENTHFSDSKKLGGAQAVSNTGWTVAGMVSQTAGTPVKLSIDGNTLGEYDSFLPGVYGLGEILKKEGYNNYLMMGSDSNFGGRSSYFKQHGNYDIYDFNSAIKEKKISKDYWVNWGFEDLKLFEYAKEKITMLSNKEQPFNFAMLTVDTHFLEGYTDDTCEHLNTNIYANAVMCSDKKVYNFVRWIQEQPFYENTTIVISGDHLLMGNYLFPAEYDKKRTVYNVIINPRVTSDNTKERVFTTMDMFPTTLASLGVKIDGERLGLGTNLFSNKKTLAEKLGIKKFDNELSKKSDYYNDKLLYENKKN